MSNTNTEKNGIDAVIAYEKARGRTGLRVNRCGYDIESYGNGEERHIEVKSTGKSSFTRRWLEELEYQTLQKDDKFWVYLVTNANSQPYVSVLNATEVKARFKGEIKHYCFDFS